MENADFLKEFFKEDLPGVDLGKVTKISERTVKVIEKKEREAFVRGMLSSIKLLMPSAYAVIVLLLFSVGNICVWILVYKISMSELVMAESGKISSRLITSDVLNTLIIATASQTALAFMTIITFMYGRKNLAAER